MGYNPDDFPFIQGAACAVGERTLWAVGDTPEEVSCTLLSIKESIHCPVGQTPPDGTYTLTQNPAAPCTWQYSVFPYTIIWRLEVGKSSLYVSSGWGKWLTSENAWEGGLCFDNQNDASKWDEWGIGGTGLIVPSFIAGEMAGDGSDGGGFEQSGNYTFDAFPISTNKIAIRLAYPEIGLNLTFKYDPEER